MFADVQQKMKKRNALLFSRDSECLQELKRLIQQQKHRTVVMWALDCGQAPLAAFEGKYPREPRPRVALELSQAWARGQVKMPVAQRAILGAHAVAKELDDKEYGALCHAIGHAGATVHTQTHALGLPFYELTALVLRFGRDAYEEPVRRKIEFYEERLRHWQEHIHALEGPWARFLLEDSRPNREKLLSLKKEDALGSGSGAACGNG